MAAKEESQQFRETENFKPEALSQVLTVGIKDELVRKIKEELKDGTWHFSAEEGDSQGIEDVVHIKEEFPQVLNNLVEEIKSEEDSGFTLFDGAEASPNIGKPSFTTANLNSKEQETKKENIPECLIEGKLQIVCNCAVCCKSNSRKDNFKYHVPIHEEKRYKCAICAKLYSTKPTLKFHFDNHFNKIKNLDVKPYKCAICAQLYSTKRTLKVHLGSHFSETKNRDVSGRIQCSICGKYFSLKHNLMEHLLVHQSKESKCPLCSRIFVTPRGLRKHLQAHRNERCICSMCGLSYHNKDSLKRHFKRHHKTRHYPDSLSAESVTGKLLRIQKGHFHSALNGRKRPRAVEKRGGPKELETTVIVLQKRKGKQNTKLIPFRNLHITQRKEIMLSWILKESSVQEISLKHRKGNKADIELCIDNIPDSVKDDDVHIELLEEYFEPGAWNVLLEVVKRKKNCELWMCGYCRSALKTDPCICCDSCLLWYHLTCMKLRSAPKTKLWICTKCHK